MAVALVGGNIRSFSGSSSGSSAGTTVMAVAVAGFAAAPVVASKKRGELMRRRIVRCGGQGRI